MKQRTPTIVLTIIVFILSLVIVYLLMNRNHSPVIEELLVSPLNVATGEDATITVIATDDDGDALAYYWSAIKGNVPSGDNAGSSIVYTALPSTSGLDTITVIITDGEASVKKEIKISIEEKYPVAHDTPTSPTDEPISPTSTPIPPTDESVLSTDTPIPPTDESVLSTDTPIPPTDTPTSIAMATETQTFTPTPLPITQVTANQTGNVRSGPGTAYDNVGTATNGETFEVLGTLEDNSWWFINFVDQEGWIHNSLVSLEGPMDDLEIVTPPPPPVSTLWVDNFDDCNNFNSTGGENGSAYKDGMGYMVESYPIEEGHGCVARLEYDITWWSAFFMKLQHSDLSPYSRISFWIKAEAEGNPGQIKVEIKRVCTKITENETECREIEIAYIPVSTSWEQKFINLSAFQETGWSGFGPITDWTDIEELVFTVESNGSQKQGVFDLDNIAFSP